jgi:SNF2 family DNA or RNA helicase
MNEISLNNFLEHAKLDAYDYQKEGIEWCYKRENSLTNRGGILADEMGLGKTITMLAVIVLQIKKLRKTLIVVPPYLIEQWESQIKKYIGHKPLIYYGINKKHISEIKNNNYITLTSYACLNYKFLQSQSWDRVIFDEAHHMRNPRTLNFQNANKLHSKTKWLLTGTPIQNKMNDIYSLFKILNIDEEEYKKEENMKNIICKYILRRTKKEVGLDKTLPSKTEDSISIKWNNKNEKNNAINVHSLLSFANINSPVLEESLHSPIVNLLRAKLMCVLGTTNSKNKNTYSSKLAHVINKIKENKDNNKRKIIFCHFRTEIDIINEELKSENIKCHVIDGRITSKAKRQKILNDSTNEILILQIKVGAEGLNLQNYSEIYFISPCWNPFIEEQAIARCYRLGQKESVNVYRFYMEEFDENKETKSQEIYCRETQESKKQIEKELFYN